jgi:hypothetical protein
MNAIQRRDRGEALRSIARSYNVSPSTISRLAAEAAAGGACNDGQKH